MGAAGAAAPWGCTMDRLTPLAADPSLSSPPSFSYYTIYHLSTQTGIMPVKGVAST